MKGTVEEHGPAAAFPEMGFKKGHIVLVTTASLLCSSYIHARVFYSFHFLNFFMALGKLLFLPS